MARKRDVMQQAAAAAAAAAVAASESSNSDHVLDLAADPEDLELAEDLLEGLRRLDSGGNKITWYVYSESPGSSGSSEGYIEKLKSEQLDEARFKTVYGPGEYRIVGRSKDGSYVKGSHTRIKISDIGATNRQNQSHDAVSMLREMRVAEEQRATKRAEDLRTYATILATPLATLGAALIARRPAIDVAALVTALRPQQNTLGEMTTALVNLKQLEGGSGSSNVDVVLKVLEKLQDLPTGAGGDTGWLGFVRDLVKEAAPHAREIIGQLAQPARPAGQLPPGAVSGPPFILASPPNGSAPAMAISAPTSVSPVGVTAQPSTQPGNGTSQSQPPSEELEMFRAVEPWLKRKAEDLLESASTNMPIDLEAERLLVAFDKKFKMFVSRQDLKGWLTHPDWWKYVVGFYPTLQPYHAWIDDLREELLAQLAEQEETNGAGSSQEERPDVE
jgi:hypothetical protein